MEQFNFLTIVADSCRWDSFQASRANNIREHFDVVSAGAMATFTYPAHMAMFQGFFPTTNGARPVYNRFKKSVYRWFYKSMRSCLYELNGSGSIPLVLRDSGHRTVAVGGVGWFNKRTPMKLGFEEFVYRPNGVKAVDTFIACVDSEPYYGVLNFGTTHRPYRVPGMPRDLAKVKNPRSGNYYKSIFRHELVDKQAVCMAYTDVLLVKIFDWIKSSKLRTIVCFCADHGDCMGEDNCYGHGFYHSSIMTVPLAWTIFMPGGEYYPITENNLKVCGF